MNLALKNKDKFLSVQAQTSPFPFLVDVQSAKGCCIFDTNGKRYIDMIAGVAVNNIGHNHPKVIKAIKKQVDQHLHVMVYGEFIQQAQLKFAEKLTALLPEKLNSVYTVNSGTEANEAALKLAKRITGRSEMIACYGAYHGSTHGSLSVSANETRKQAFRPLLPNVKFIKHNNIEDLSAISEKTALVIIEPIQGDAGVRIASLAYLKALREKCNETGTLLIFDEIQCGMGRTGKMFAFEHYEVFPDILTLGKGLGGGMPIGALVSAKKYTYSFTNNPMLGHITTFGGHPVNCAAGEATLHVLEKEVDLVAVEQKGLYIENRLNKLKNVRAIRRIGLMLAIDLQNAKQVEEVVKKCLDQGVITFWFLSHPESFRLSPPLTISEEELNEALTIVCRVIESIR